MLPQLDPLWYPSEIFWSSIFFTLTFIVTLKFSRKVSRGIKCERRKVSELNKESKKIQEKIFHIAAETKQIISDANSQAQAIHQKASLECQGIKEKSLLEALSQKSALKDQNKRSLVNKRSALIKKINQNLDEIINTLLRSSKYLHCSKNKNKIITKARNVLELHQ